MKHALVLILLAPTLFGAAAIRRNNCARYRATLKASTSPTRG